MCRGVFVRGSSCERARLRRGVCVCQHTSVRVCAGVCAPTCPALCLARRLGLPGGGVSGVCVQDHGLQEAPVAHVSCLTFWTHHCAWGRSWLPRAGGLWLSWLWFCLLRVFVVNRSGVGRF